MARRSPMDDERHLHFTPYLYIRAFPNDGGARALGGGAVFWASPDIDFFPKVNGNPVANTEVTVQATITNGGYLPAVGVTVDFFWFTPAPVFVPTDGNRINKTPVLVTIPAQSSVQVTCPTPWIPTFIGDGHECLVVQCNSFLEGGDGLKFPLHAELDRHVAQRNLMVSDASADGQKLQLRVQNPFDAAVGFSVYLSSRRVRGDFAQLREQDPDMLMRVVANASPGGPHDLIEQELDLTVEDISGVDLGVRVLAMEPLSATQAGTLNPDDYLKLRGGAGTGKGDALGRRLGEFELAPGGNGMLFLEAPQMDVGEDAYRVLHFSQAVQNCVVGGYTIVIEPLR